MWAEKVAAAGAPKTVTNETAFLVDFPPVVRRSLTRTGFVLDHLQYYSDAFEAADRAAGQVGLGGVAARSARYRPDLGAAFGYR
ncbi:hypothetical protein [Nocardia terpenica]|uniref:hypothetical protein n=1 Tax=Nocardia terpenica TaxID=455432 RepID=UPI0015842A68|nr:hypothetical protein [Nocardia terpenica]